MVGHNNKKGKAERKQKCIKIVLQRRALEGLGGIFVVRTSREPGWAGLGWAGLGWAGLGSAGS